MDTEMADAERWHVAPNGAPPHCLLPGLVLGLRFLDPALIKQEGTLIEYAADFDYYDGAQWERVFATVAAEPLQPLPLGPVATLALAAAAVVVKNPAVTRRWWAWLR